MTITFDRLEPGQLDDATGEPFDRWVTPAGEVAAEFRRLKEGEFRGGYRVSFPGQAEFDIAPDLARVRGLALDGGPEGALDTLYHNSIVPLIGNHCGGLFLHGSAVAGNTGAIGVLGLSRSGKTTLAGAFARAGYPFLTEDVLELRPAAHAYMVAPQRPVLRVFGDSAAFLTGDRTRDRAEAPKGELPASDLVPFTESAAPLRGLCLLGPGEAAGVALDPLGEAEALRQLFGHAFLLDVEDRAVLNAHFDRLARLVARIPCYALDYPRRYEQLPGVIETVAGEILGERGNANG